MRGSLFSETDGIYNVLFQICNKTIGGTFKKVLRVLWWSAGESAEAGWRAICGVLNIQNQASLDIAHVQASEALWEKSRWWQEQLEGCLSVMGNVQSYLSSVQVVVCQCQQLPSKTHSVCKISIIFTIRANSNFGGFRTISSTGDGS
jgi:hypothetical protein